MLLLFACHEECFQFCREGDSLPNILCETRRAWATYAGLCNLFRLSMFSGRAHTPAHWQWLPCWQVMLVLTFPIVFSHYFAASGEKNMLRAFVHPQGNPIFLLYPIAWAGPMTEVSARALALACLPCSVPQSRSELHKPACMKNPTLQAFVCKAWELQASCHFWSVSQWFTHSCLAEGYV